MEENYDRAINLNNKTHSTLFVNSIVEQLNRLKLCVKNLKYKIGIICNKFLCYIHRDGEEIYSYVIEDYPVKDDNFKLYITIDLENFYQKIDSIGDDVKSIRNGIFDILNRNQLKMTQNLRTVIENGSSVNSYSEILYNKKNRYGNYISRLEKSMNRILEHEKTVIDKLNYYNSGLAESSISGLESDIGRTKKITTYEKEIEKINIVKQDIIKNLAVIKIKQDNIMLKIDKIFFENSAVLDLVLKNIRLLYNLGKN